MIICPNCGKEVAEDAAHCGHCGQQIEVEQKKTMMGLGAVDPDAWKKRIAEAEKAKAAKGEDSKARDSEDSSDAFSLPKPGDTAPQKDFVTASTEAMDAVDPAEADVDIAGAATELMSTVPGPMGADSALEEPATDDGFPEMGETEETPSVVIEDSADESLESDAEEDWKIGEPATPAKELQQESVFGSSDDAAASGLEIEEEPLVGKPEVRGPGGPAKSSEDIKDVDDGELIEEQAVAKIGDGGSIDSVDFEDEDGSKKKLYLLIGGGVFLFLSCCVIGPIIAWIFVK